MIDFAAELKEHTIRQITLGKSGAEVYELTDNRIAKRVLRDALPDEARWESYLQEAKFYEAHAASQLPFLPEVFFCHYDESEIQLILRKHRPVELSVLQEDRLDQIMCVLAAVHQLPIPAFLPKAERVPITFSDEKLTSSRDGWLSVLSEHPGIFSQDAITAIADKINTCNHAHFSALSVCCHGDFHRENLLLDATGAIRVCDWQSVGGGHPAGDISFFCSRLAADGYPIRTEDVISAYCRHTTLSVSSEEICRQMALSNLNTSFEFWHYFLHGSDESRVREIYDRMIEDFAALS